MHPSVQSRILASTQAQSIRSIQLIQPLWNNYGTLSRIHLDGGVYPSVILKHIQIPSTHQHPKGFGNDFSRQRKIQSYRVEQYWYQHYNNDIAYKNACQTPKCLDTVHAGGEIFLLLEDLHVRGFHPLSYRSTWKEIHSVLRWLAHFHAHFLQQEPIGLWEIGTYWQLNTRPHEREELRGSILYHLAPFIHEQLNSSSWFTLLHGDAKVANFCFHTSDYTVAAVDFQYIGKGCGMSDLAYFVGSIMNEKECEKNEKAILDTYFEELSKELSSTDILAVEIEKQWRPLYHVAWADFQRFLLGWSPHHSKHTSYAQRCTNNTINTILDELLHAAITASKEAGTYILQHWKKNITISSKGLDGTASDIVTNIDLRAQEIILQHLQPSIQSYKLGVLAEETQDDKSRLHRHAFWTIDPLDGTRYFAHGKAGFAVSIALVSHTGESILGVVFDPVQDLLYHCISGSGVYCNNVRLSKPDGIRKAVRAADISLSKHPNYGQMQQNYNIHFCGGAILNIIYVMKQSHAFYGKTVRVSLGGCAIWDLAAATLMLKEMGGTSCFVDGSPLHLNRSSTTYFHDVGIICVSKHLSIKDAQEMLWFEQPHNPKI